MTPKRTQPGFAMMLVLILVSVGVVLGFSYLSTASLKAQVAENYRGMSRARYLAESGLEHAVYTLRFSPDEIDDVMLGPYTVDVSGDSYYMCAQGLPGQPGYYRLTATSTTGSVKQSSSVVVYRSNGRRVDVNKGVLVKGGLVWLPWGLSVSGNLHVNGSLYNMARIDGDVSVTGNLSDPWWRIDGDTDDDADTADVPRVRINDYKKYSIGSQNYKAVDFKNTHLTHSDPLANGGAVTDTNVAGVVEFKPKKKTNYAVLHDNLDFTGTLMIKGDLILDGENIHLQAVDGFPALVVTGSIYVTNSARNVTIDGLVVAGRGIRSNGWTPSASTTINGALISDSRGYDSSLYGTHQLNFDSDLAAVYDMSLDPEERIPEVIVLDWND